MPELTGKVAVITGSTRGFGAAIAEACARAGAAVVIFGRSAKVVQTSVANLQSKGYQAAGLAGDVSYPDDLQKLLDLALAQFGHVDIWVNNAGVSAPYGPTLDVEVADFESVINTNILGTYYGSRLAAQYFKKQGSGKLINILGRGEKQPVPLQNAYASSKTWIRTFTLALAKEYQNSGFGVFAFNPGMMLTDMMTGVETVPGYTAAVKPLITVLHFWGQPSDVPASKVVWLASAATDGKTGLAVSQNSFGFLLAGVARELIRQLLHRPDPLPEIIIREKTPPAPQK